MKSILIVDDQFGVRILLNEVFKTKGYNTYQAANGLQALQIIKKHRIDLIMLDIKIPGMNGIEIYKRALEMGYNKPVITMTAYEDELAIRELKDLGASTHFDKPIDMEELLQAVKELLGIKKIN